MPMDNPQRLLIIQLKRAGDVIVTTPVLQALKSAFPQAKIDFLVDKPFATLLENNPFVNEVVVHDRQAPWTTWKKLRAADYDGVFDFQSSPRSILAGIASGTSIRAGYKVTFWRFFLNHAIKRPGNSLSVTEGKMSLVRSLLPGLGQAGERKIYLTDSERAWARQQMAEAKEKKSVMGLIPTHRRSSRRWGAKSFAQLARLLFLKGHSVWLFWGPGEKEYVSAIQRQVPECHMIPETSLRQMAALLEQCQVVITNDNGPMHLAEAVGAKTVTFYGPTDPRSWNVGGSQHQVLQAEGLTCLGCNLNVCPFEHECMNDILPEHVLAHVI